MYRRYRADIAVLKYVTIPTKMEGVGNTLLAIGFLMYGSSFTWDDFWEVTNNATAAILNVVAILSIITGTWIKVSKNWKEIKDYFKKK